MAVGRTVTAADSSPSARSRPDPPAPPRPTRARPPRRSEPHWVDPRHVGSSRPAVPAPRRLPVGPALPGRFMAGRADGPPLPWDGHGPSRHGLPPRSPLPRPLVPGPCTGSLYRVLAPGAAPVFRSSLVPGRSTSHHPMRIIQDPRGAPARTHAPHDTLRASRSRYLRVDARHRRSVLRGRACAADGVVRQRSSAASSGRARRGFT